jgi:hypothetical protein
VQLALRPDWMGFGARSGRSQSGNHVNRLMAAGVAVVGASLIAVNPLAPNVAADIQHNVVTELQHRAVQLTSGGTDVIGAYGDIFGQTSANLQALASQGSQAYSTLLGQTGANLSGTGNLLGSALQGAQVGLQNSLYGGWYGGDDGFVFGLFGGTVTHAGVTESGSTLQEISSSLSQGNLFNALAYADEWYLETLDHTGKSLLSPLLSTAKTGAPATPTLANTFLTTLNNVTNTFLTYANLKNLANGLLSPAISVTFGTVFEAGQVGSDVGSLNFPAALADTLKAPGDVAGDLLNGFVYPGQFNPTGSHFAGLLNNGSVLQDLLVTWPNQLAYALGSQTVSGGIPSAAAAMTGGLSQAASSLLPNLAALAAQPAAMAANLGANLGAALSPMLANIAAQLSATLAPNVISALLLHLPALILAML